MRIQSLEEYKRQLDAFHQSGPQINNESWLYDRALDVAASNPSSKIDRSAIVHACELAYYMRDYDKCLATLLQAKDAWSTHLDKGVARDLGSLDLIEIAVRLKLAM